LKKNWERAIWVAQEGGGEHGEEEDINLGEGGWGGRGGTGNNREAGFGTKGHIYKKAQGNEGGGVSKKRCRK